MRIALWLRRAPRTCRLNPVAVRVCLTGAPRSSIMSAMDELRIQPMARADVDAVVALARVIWREHYPGIITSEQIEYMLAKMYTPAIIREELERKGILWLTASVGGELVGFASYGPQAEPGVMKLHKLYLLARMRGKGRGSALLQQVVSQARAAGATTLILSVNKRNQTAINAYLRNGFNIAQAVKIDIGGGFVMDDYIMSKPLSKPEPGRQKQGVME